MKLLASAIAYYEGKKSQARIGEIREILKIISALGASGVVTQDSIDEYEAYDSKICARAAKLRERGLSPEAVLAKLLGQKPKNVRKQKKEKSK